MLNTRLGRANWKGVWGWALDPDSPTAKVEVEIVLNDEVVGRVTATEHRPNMTHLPPEKRYCGFQFLFPNGLSALSRHVVRARSAADGTEFEHSPMIVEASPGFDPALEQTVGNALEVAVSAAQTQAELDEPLEFVVDQIGKLLAARKALPGGDSETLPPGLAGLDERFVGLLRDGAGLAAAFPDPDRAAPLRRVLIIGDPAPVLDDSSRLLLAHVRALARLGLSVEFVASEFRADAKAQIAAVEAIGVMYHRPPLSPTVEEVLRRNRGLYDVVLLWRIGNFEKYAALARSYCPLARIVFDADNLFFIRMLRRAGLQNWPAGVEKGEALRSREIMAAWGSHAVITTSRFEAELLRKSVPQGNVHVVTWPAEPQAAGAPFADRAGVGLLGDFQLHADLDAAAWLIEVLMPAVWAIDPSMVCVIAGVNMPEVLRSLSRDGIEIVDQVAGRIDNPNAVLDRLRLSVVVQRAGAGVPPGLVASWARGVPCVGNAVAMEGLALPDDLRGCVAGDVQALAALVCRLHSDEAAHAAHAEAGLRYVEAAFSESVVDQQMLAVVGVETGASAFAGGVAAAARP